MFEVEEGGVSTPIKWSRSNLASDKSIIVIDEKNLTLWLWHGKRQNLVSRRVALRQAQSLKGHGFQVGKSIIGRDIRRIVEIDERKIGRDPETDKSNEGFQKLLDTEYQEVGNNIISFTMVDEEAAPAPKAAAPAAPKEKPKPTPKAVAQPKEKVALKPAAKALEEVPTPASEYEIEEELPKVVKPEERAKAKLEPVKADKVPEKKVDPLSDARVGFVLIASLEEFKDIWASIKPDGSIAIEMMDGPVCEFTIQGHSIKFSANSFTGVDPQKKKAIQARFVELSKLIR